VYKPFSYIKKIINDKGELMKKEKVDFTNKVLKQLNIMFGIEEGNISDYNELKILLYMHMISYHFDDREPINKTNEELYEIAKKCVGTKTYDDPEIGKVQRCRTEDAIRLNNLRQKNSTEEERMIWAREFSRFILENTRNSIAHGAFFVNNSKIVEIDNTFEKSPFKMKYDFDCLIDVCEELSNKEQLSYYEDLLECIEQNKKMDFSNDQNKLIYFDLAISALIGYNENEVYNPKNGIIRSANNLYGLNTNLDTIKHIRNSVIHHYRTLDVNNENKVKILDYKDKYKNHLSADFTIDFNKLVEFVKQVSVDDILMNARETQENEEHSL